MGWPTARPAPREGFGCPARLSQILGARGFMCNRANRCMSRQSTWRQHGRGCCEPGQRRRLWPSAEAHVKAHGQGALNEASSLIACAMLVTSEQSPLVAHAKLSDAKQSPAGPGFCPMARGNSHGLPHASHFSGSMGHLSGLCTALVPHSHFKCCWGIVICCICQGAITCSRSVSALKEALQADTRGQRAWPHRPAHMSATKILASTAGNLPTGLQP